MKTELSRREWEPSCLVLGMSSEWVEVYAWAKEKTSAGESSTVWVSLVGVCLLAVGYLLVLADMQDCSIPGRFDPRRNMGMDYHESQDYGKEAPAHKVRIGAVL